MLALDNCKTGQNDRTMLCQSLDDRQTGLSPLKGKEGNEASPKVLPLVACPSRLGLRKTNGKPDKAPNPQRVEMAELRAKDATEATVHRADAGEEGLPAECQSLSPLSLWVTTCVYVTRLKFH